MEQRLSPVTLGVADLEPAAAFYAALGWQARAAPVDTEVVFFQTVGLVVALWGREQLAEDSAVADTGGWGGVTLAQNVRPDRTAGRGHLLGGGYSGMFVDPDGHPWEIAHNPDWVVTDDGATLLGEGGA